MEATHGCLSFKWEVGRTAIALTAPVPHDFPQSLKLCRGSSHAMSPPSAHAADQVEYEINEDWFVWPFDSYKPRLPTKYDTLSYYMVQHGQKAKLFAGSILIGFDIFHPKLHEYHMGLLEKKTIKHRFGPDLVVYGSTSLLRERHVHTEPRTLLVSCMGLRDLQDLPGSWFEDGRIEDAKMRFKIGDGTGLATPPLPPDGIPVHVTRKKKRDAYMVEMGPHSTPTMHDPNFFEVEQLRVDWPTNPLFIPNLMAICYVMKYVFFTKREKVRPSRSGPGGGCGRV